jgi:hypothetical protein
MCGPHDANHLKFKSRKILRRSGDLPRFKKHTIGKLNLDPVEAEKAACATSEVGDYLIGKVQQGVYGRVHFKGHCMKSLQETINKIS